MITQINGQCFEYRGGGFDVDFLDDSAPVSRLPSAEILRFPVSAAPVHTGDRFTPDQIIPLQKIITPVLAKYGQRFELCGSYRRGKATVKDLDYVIECTRENFALLRAELTVAGVEFHRGANEIMNGYLQGVAVDFFRGDAESYISILIWRTGSANHNIYCATVARRRKMRILRTGIEKDGATIHPKTEAEFYSILGVPFMRPDQRDMEG